MLLPSHLSQSPLSWNCLLMYKSSSCLESSLWALPRSPHLKSWIGASCISSFFFRHDFHYLSFSPAKKLFTIFIGDCYQRDCDGDLCLGSLIWDVVWECITHSWNLLISQPSEECVVTVSMDASFSTANGINLLAYKSSWFSEIHSCASTPSCTVKSEDQPPAGFPNHQAGIELLSSFLKFKGDHRLFVLPVYQPFFYIISRRFIRRHIPFVKPSQFANKHSLYRTPCFSVFFIFLLSHPFFLVPLRVLCIAPLPNEMTLLSPIGANYMVKIQLTWRREARQNMFSCTMWVLFHRYFMLISNVMLRSLAVSALAPCSNHLLKISPISYLTYARHVCNLLHLVIKYC